MKAEWSWAAQEEIGTQSCSLWLESNIMLVRGSPQMRTLRCALTVCVLYCRFRWMAIRVWVTRMWRASLAAVYFAFNWLIYKLDYARGFRWACPSHRQTWCLTCS